jgi:hypothetical protein
MSTVLERPELQDAEPIQTHSRNIINREDTRYLFLALDLIEPQRKQEQVEYEHGGEMLQGFCSWRTHGFLRRCRITPLEMGHDPQPRDLIAEGASVVTIPIPLPERQAALTGLSHAEQVFVRVYPGEEINSILYNQHRMERGVVEIKALMREAWDKEKMDALQRFFFPTYPKLPATLREIENLIKAARTRTEGETLHSIADDMLLGCARSRTWGMTMLEHEHANVRKGTNAAGESYTYSPLAEVLLPQLEVQRQDEGLKPLADLTRGMFQSAQAQVAQQSQFDPTAFYKFMAANQEALVNQMFEKFKEMPPAPMESAAPDEPLTQETQAEGTKPKGNRAAKS